MSDPGPVRCGVVGVGYLGQHHARIYASMEGAVLAGVLETDDARAGEITGRYGCRRFASLEEVAAACDVVSVVVPTDRHCAVALPLLAAGRHLLIEKPLCTTMEEAALILAAARASGSVVQVGHIEHFNPVMAWLEKEVHQPRLINAFRHAPYQPRGTEVGVTLDLMIHDIGIVLRLARGAVRRVEATGMRVLSPTEDIAHARVTFDNGCVANLSTSRLAHEKQRRIEVFQPSALLAMDFINQEGWLTKKVGNTMQREHVPLVKVEPLRAELEAFVASVRGRMAPTIDAEFGRDALGIALDVSSQIRATFGGENLAPVTRYVTAASANRRVTSRTFLRPPATDRPDLLVLAGEHSGDQHAAALVKAYRDRRPGATVAALGGPALAAAGAEVLLDMTRTSVVGFAEVLRHLGHFLRILYKTVDWIATYQPRAVLFVDYPGLNLRVARALREKGISRKGGGNVRALFYISPQVWAWKRHRRFTMAEDLDALGVIFPFEPEVFADTRLPVEFVGHPFMAPGAFRPVVHAADGPVLLLPGSRVATVERNYPVMLAAFAEVRRERPALRAVTVYPDEPVREVLAGHLRRAGLAGVVELASHDVVTSGRCALVTSGTMTLHCALAGLPGAVVYRTSGISYSIAKRVSRLKHIGMPNLLLPRPVYPELIQHAATPAALGGELRALLDDPARTEAAAAAAGELRRVLTPPGQRGVLAWLLGQIDAQS